MQNAEKLIDKIEKRLKERIPNGNTCQCTTRRFFFRVTGYTDEQNEALFNGTNVKHCPKCHKMNMIVEVPDERDIQEL